MPIICGVEDDTGCGDDNCGALRVIATFAMGGGPRDCDVTRALAMARTL